MAHPTFPVYQYVVPVRLEIPKFVASGPDRGGHAVQPYKVPETHSANPSPKLHSIFTRADW
jgi:hypothetical protein